MQLDHGAILRKETGHETPKMIRWIVAKPEVIQTGSGRLVPGSRLVWSGSGLKSTWMENALSVEVQDCGLNCGLTEFRKC